MPDTGMTIGLIKALGSQPDPEDVAAAVAAYLEAHPEATCPIDDTAGEGDTDKVWSADKTASLSSAIVPLQPSASASDVGKYMKVKTVADGKVTEYEFGASSGSGAEIDDTAGHGDTTVVWSAGKTFDEINELDIAVFATGQGAVTAPDLFQTVTDTDMQLSIGSTAFEASASVAGFYVDVSDYKGKTLLIKRTNASSVLRGVFTQNIPAVGVTYTSDNKWQVDVSEKHATYVTVPNSSSIKYMYVMYYNSSPSSMTKQQAIEGMTIFEPDETNHYADASEDMMLSFTDGYFTQASSLYGFYIPINDPSADSLYVSRTNAGSRFRFGFSTAVPAIGVAYSNYTTNAYDAWTNVYLPIPSGAKYLYVAYYRTSDTLTKEQLLAGMNIRFCVPTTVEVGKKVNRIDNLDFSHEINFVNGAIDSSGVFSTDTKTITSDPVRVDGDFMISVPSDYVMKIHLFDDDGNYISTTEKTDKVEVLSHKGLVRFSISASDDSAVTPETVDFSKIKMPSNWFSAKAYAEEKTFVLDAENSMVADVYAYIDKGVASHGYYATKTLLCSESTGLPIYYYTLGSGNKKACLVGGQHGGGSDGDPRDSVITLAKVVRDLIDGNFENGSFLKELHDDYTVLVIPVLNPYGFNNRTRENANNVDLNRDWASPTTTEVTAAKSLISTFSPDIALDVHCNGTTPVYNQNIEIQFGLGSYNSTYKSAVRTKFKEYYDTDVAERSPNTETTLQYYIITTLGIPGGLLELRWWIKSKKWMHDAQAESANYAMLVNVLRFCGATHDNQTYTWEHTPNQNQY